MTLTYNIARKLLPPGDRVYFLDDQGGIQEAVVLEVCDGWLETSVGILDFEDHRCNWWLTRKCAENWR